MFIKAVTLHKKEASISIFADNSTSIVTDNICGFDVLIMNVHTFIVMKPAGGCVTMVI